MNDKPSRREAISLMAAVLPAFTITLAPPSACAAESSGDGYTIWRWQQVPHPCTTDIWLLLGGLDTAIASYGAWGASIQAILFRSCPISEPNKWTVGMGQRKTVIDAPDLATAQQLAETDTVMRVRQLLVELERFAFRSDRSKP